MRFTAQNHLVAKILLFILALLLLVLAFLLFLQYREIKRTGIIQSEKAHFQNLKSAGPLTIADTDYIEPWMTFSYIIVSFKIPVDYLKGSLGISAVGYPNITLGKYARSAATSTEGFTSEVREVLRAYLSTQASSTVTH